MPVATQIRVFRSPRWYVALVTIAELLFSTGAWYAYATRGLHAMTMVALALAVLGMLGVIEVLFDRVVLTGDVLQINRIWSRRSFSRREIVGVTQLKGTAVTLKLADGRWVELPAVAVHPNTIRAWLRTTSQDV